MVDLRFKKSLLTKLEKYADDKIATTDCWSGCSCRGCYYNLGTDDKPLCSISTVIYGLNKEIEKEISK